MLYAIGISVVGFALLTKLLKDDIVEFNLNRKQAFINALIYLTLCLIIPIGELLFIYAITSIPPHIINTTPTTPSSLVTLMMGTYVPLLIATLFPVYASAMTLISIKWSRHNDIEHNSKYEENPE